MDLTELGGPGAELSTGLILSWRERLIFGLDPRAVPLGSRGQAGVLAFVGVGGHLEPGEGWCAAVTREAMEEASCDVALADSPVTYLCRQDEAPQPIEYDWGESARPLLVWLATFRLRRGPQRALTAVPFVNAVFRATALAEPVPAAEMTGLLGLDENMLLWTYAQPQPCGDLLARGARIIGRPPAPGTFLAPGGSAYFYAQWLAWQGGVAKSRNDTG